MELIINRKKFLSALMGVCGVAAKNSAVPILENVKVVVRKDGTIVVTAFDLAVSAMRKFRFADSAKSLEFCINPRDLSDILKSLRNEDVVLEIDNSRCTVRHDKGEMVLPVYPAEDFPVPETEKENTKVIFDAPKFFDWIRNASRFVHTDPIRPILCGIYIYVDGNEAGVCASDTTMLFYDNTTLEGTHGIKVDGVLTTKAIKPLLDMINGCDKVTVYFGEKILSFRTDNAMLTAVKPVGKYVNFRPLLAPKSNFVRVVISGAELTESVSRVLLSSQAGTYVLTFSSKGNIFSMDCEDTGYSKKSHEECVCDIQGIMANTSVNGSKMQCCLSAIESDNVRIEFGEKGQQPIHIYDESSANKVILLMPCIR